MKVKFNAKKHQYTLVDDKGKKINDLVSVTTLLKKHGIAPDYSMVDDETLNAKAKRGSVVHEELENYINNGEEMGFTNELVLFMNKCREMRIKPLISEFIVHNEEIAGTVDVAGVIGENELPFIGDFKTTTTLHKKAVAWQLSLYAYLQSENIYEKFLVFHFPDAETCKVIELQPIPESEIEELLRCERDCEIYQEKTLDLDQATSNKLVEIQTALKTLEEQKKELEFQENALKEYLIKKFEETGLDFIENEFFRIKYTAPTTQERIDSTRLKKEMPEIASQYTKVSPVKAKITITLRKEE